MSKESEKQIYGMDRPWIDHFDYYDLLIPCSQDGVGKQGKALGTVERYLVGQGLIEVLPSLIQPR